MMKFFKKYHKWISIVLSVFLILFSLSGIVLNHRKTFSPFNVKRSILPDEYEYDNWNNAAVLSTCKLNSDTILIYGNIGVWLTDSLFNSYSDFNSGFLKGIDNRKITSMVMNNKDLFAGTYFGLFQYSFIKNEWFKIAMPVKEQRISDLIIKDDSLFVLTRSYLLKSSDYSTFSTHELPAPEGYNNKVGLFKTFWVIHSGEIYGIIGKLIVDLVGVIFIFLTVTGLILFINKRRIRSRGKLKKQISGLRQVFKWNLRWHNKIGWITFIVLVLTTFTGMFLRPPLIAFIGNSQVSKIPFTELDSPNPWFDKLRRISYEEESNRFLIATLDGMYYSDDDFKSDLKRFEHQPPASVMGVTVFKKTKPNTYLVGSFEGLFEWNFKSGIIFDYIKKTPYIKPVIKGPPIGEFTISGYTDDYLGQEIIFDYGFGAACISKRIKFPEMPEYVIQESPMSLWNLALEVHTARLYKIFMGPFYILFIPLSGVLILFVLISGFIVWLKSRKRKN